MRNLTIAATLLAAATVPGTAQAEGTYQVRNASRTPLTCLMRAPAREIGRRFGLAPGQTHRLTLATGEERLLTCMSTVARRATFLIRAGLAYELTETSSGMLRIRTVAGH